MYTLNRTITLPIAINEAWIFFSNPKNLATITPPELGFKINSNVPDKIYAGLIIEYSVTPLGPLPMTWVSEISQVSEPHLFVDEQRQGPYKFWHHQHHFKEVAQGTEIQDIVNYRLGMGIFGQIAHALVVKQQLDHIFDFRTKALSQRFPTPR